LEGRRLIGVACGSSDRATHTTAAVAANGELWLWGRIPVHEEGGSRGINQLHDALVPQRCSLAADDAAVSGRGRALRCVSVSCGGGHFAAIGEGGHLFTWGSGRYGVLGHGSRDDECVPRAVASLRGVRIGSVSCGECHTAAVEAVRPAATGAGCVGGTQATCGGRLWSWGRGLLGRLGHTSDVDDCEKPALVRWDPGGAAEAVSAVVEVRSWSLPPPPSALLGRFDCEALAHRLSVTKEEETSEGPPMHRYR
jgi:hypothetical protein